MKEPTTWWLAAAGAITAVGAAISVLTRGVKWMLKTWRKLGDFLEDWNGEEARPGHARQPGIPERLSTLEADLAAVKAQVSPNGGGSLLDKVDKIKTAVEG